MKVTQGSTRSMRLQNIFFMVLFLAAIGLLAGLSTRYHYQSDWTATSRNTLSDASVSVLAQMPEPLIMTAFAADADPIKKHITDLVARYQRHKNNITVVFVNPDTEPKKLRELGITHVGEVVVVYQGRSEKITALGEQNFTNMLQRLSRAGERWLVFLEGHGERSFLGQKNHDLQSWAQALKQKGFNLKGLNLANDRVIPSNTSVLILAGPQVDYLPGEVTLIETYVRDGGHLLWLLEPGDLYGLDGLAEQLGITFEPGVIVDPTTQLYAIENPTFAIVGDYGMHPLTRDFDLLTVYPEARGLVLEPPQGWQGGEFLVTAAGSWSETGEMSGDLYFDEFADVSGPLSIGVSLNRVVKEDAPQQRVVVMGDGDFISNAYLGNAGNLDMGMNIVNWLSSDDQLLSIPTKTALDTALDLSEGQSMVIGLTFLVFMPLGFVGAGVVIWFKRRKA